MSEPSAPPGYHPDPWSPENLRWWDGERWSESTIPKLPALPGVAGESSVPPAPTVPGVSVPAPPETVGDVLPAFPRAVAADPVGETAPAGLAWSDDLAPAPSPGGSPRSRLRAPLVVAVVAVVVLVFGGVAVLALGGDDDSTALEPASSTASSISPSTPSSSSGGADGTSGPASAPATSSPGSPSPTSVVSPASGSSGPSGSSGSSTPAPTAGSTAPGATAATPAPTATGPVPSDPAPAPPPVVGLGGAFGDPLGNFRLVTGPAWELIVESGELASSWFVGPSVGGLRENVNVVTETLTSPGVTVEVYLDAAIAQLDRGQPDLDVVDRRSVTLVSGAVGGRVEYGGSINDVDVRIVQIVAIGSGKAVVATFTATPSRFDSTLTQVEPFLLTLEVV